MAPMSSPSQTFDHILFPSYRQALAYRRRVAAEEGPRALFGVGIESFRAWIEDLWERYGDGRAIAGSLQREMQLRSLCEGHGEGYVRAAGRCLAAGAGLPAFDEACARAEAGEGGGVAPEEAELLALCGRCRDGLRDRGLVEFGEALALLPDALPPRSLRVCMEGFGPLDPQQRRFFDSCPQIKLVEHSALGSEGLQRAPEGIELRFAFPAGRYAWPRLAADIVAQVAEDGPVVIACADPAGFYADVADLVCGLGLSCGVRTRIPFFDGDFGRAWSSLWRFCRGETGEVCDLTDFLLSPFSGTSTDAAYAWDARLRGDRLFCREDVREELRRKSALFAAMEMLVEQPWSEEAADAVERAVGGMQERPEAWRREQFSAIAALREVAAAAREAGVGSDAVASALQEQSLPCRRLRGAAADGGSGALGADVLVCDLATAAALEPGCCATLIVADLTSAAHPASEPADVSTQILAKLGIAPVDDTLSRTRRRFHACEQLPDARLVLERPLNDVDAQPTYPAAVLEEFVDAYRADPTASDDIDNLYRLPARLQEGAWQRGEESLVENASRAAAPKPAGSVPEPPAGAVSAERRSDLLLPRVTKGGGVLEEPCLSPSQIETYLECPYKWFAGRRVKAEEIDEGFGVLQQGDFAHAALKSFYEHFQEESGHDKLTEDDLPAARKLMNEVFDRHLKYQKQRKAGHENRLLPLSELERREVEQLRGRLIDYLDYEVELLPDFHPVKLEYDVTGGEKDAVDYAGVKLVGTADRIDVDGKGHAVILDYKPSVSDRYALFSGDDGEVGGKVQALIYAQVIRRELDLDVVGALYLSYGRRKQIAGAYDAYLLGPEVLPGIDADGCGWSGGRGFKDLLDQTEERVAQALERLRAGEVEPRPADDKACGWCPVTSCPERRG